MLKKVSIFILLPILLSFLAFFLFLKNGIKLDNLSLTNVNISQLYLKLDKKLIFTVKSIEVLPSKDEPQKKSTSDFDPSIILTINNLLDYVGLVRVEDLNVANQHIFIELKDKELFVKHKEGELKLDLNVAGNDLLLDLAAKSYTYGSSLESHIKAKIDTLSTKLYKPVVKLSANAKHKDVKVELDANLADAVLKYKVSSNSIKDLNFISDFTKLEPNIQKLLDQLKFSSIKIQNVSGEQNLEKISDFDISSLNAKVNIEDLAFRYENYPRLTQKSIDLSLVDGKINVSLKAKKEEKSVSLAGMVKSSIDAKDINVDTNIYYKDIDIKTDVIVKDDVVKYNISSNRFKDIKEFEDFIQIPGAVRKWAIERLSSKGAKIDSVSGKVYLKPLNVDLSTLRVKAEVYDIVMDFNPKRAYPLNADIVYLDYDGKDMNIKLKNPRSNDVDLTGSDAVIYDMLGSNNGLLLRLQSISPLNWTLVRVVQSYDVSIPNDLGLRQTKGSSDIKTVIDIPFSDNPVDVYVKILNTDSTLKIKDKLVDFETFDFLYKDKKVIVKDTLAKYEDYNANIKDMLFDIDKSSLNLKLNAYDTKETFSIDLDNKTNLKSNTTSGNIDVNFVDIKDMVKMKDENIPYSATFGDDIDAKLPTLGIRYTKLKDEHFLKVDEFKRFEDYIIPLKKAGVQRSTLEVESRALKDVDVKLQVKGEMDSSKSYELDLKSNIDLENKTTNGFLRVYDLRYDDKLDIEDEDIPFNASFKKESDIKANLPSLNISYKKEEELHNLEIKSFNNLISLVKMLDEYDIPKASLNLQTKDFKDIDASVNVDVSKYGVFYKKVKRDSISLDVNIKDSKQIALKDKNNMLNANIVLDERPKVDLSINDLGLEYKEEKVETTAEQEKKKEEPKEHKGCEYVALDLPLVNLDMKNGYFKYNDNLVNYDSISLNTNKDKVDFALNKKDTSIITKLDDYNVDLKVSKLGEEFVNDLAGLKAIDGGLINLNAKGTQCKLDGNILIDDVTIKEASALNKIFLVINSAPAAINPFLIIPNAFRFASDGFNLSEYRIDDGKVIFNLDRDKNILDISRLEALSVHNSFYGKAQLDLTAMSIDSKVDVVFMQGLAKVISYIPAVGYWMLGDDERFSYSVDITGELSDPNINTNVAKETGMAPVNIIKRIVTYPAKLVDSATSEDEEEKKEE